MPRPILDKTGLSGDYDLSFEFARPPKAGAPVPSDAVELGLPFVEALKRQAGLDLVKTTTPASVYVIDAIHEPTPN